MTTLERVRVAMNRELDRYADFLNAAGPGLRSVAVVVKVTPNGEIRAVIITPEVERTVGIPERPRTFGEGLEAKKA